MAYVIMQHQMTMAWVLMKVAVEMVVAETVAGTVVNRLILATRGNLPFLA